MIKAGACAAILPDLPLEEVGPWARAADEAGVETVLLAAPTAPDSRLPLIVERSRGFVYGVGLVGITGERAELASSVADIARRLKDITDKPVLVGVGVSTPEQAAEVAQIADGVIVGFGADSQDHRLGFDRTGRRVRRRAAGRTRFGGVGSGGLRPLDTGRRSPPVPTRRPGLRTVRRRPLHALVRRVRRRLGGGLRGLLGANGRLVAPRT